MSIYVDDRGFLYIDDFRLPMRLIDNRELEFIDKDRIRSVARGTRIVCVPLDQFASLVDRPPMPKSELLKE